MPPAGPGATRARLRDHRVTGCICQGVADLSAFAVAGTAARQQLLLGEIDVYVAIQRQVDQRLQDGDRGEGPAIAATLLGHGCHPAAAGRIAVVVGRSRAVCLVFLAPVESIDQ